MDIDYGFPVSNNTQSNNHDYSSIINGNNKIDLFKIEANKLLNQIKSIIEYHTGKKLIDDKAKEIDEELKKSLREILIVNNNNIPNDYLAELTHIYFALYNDTLNIYYEIKNSKDYDLGYCYYVLDKKFYNDINRDNIDLLKSRNSEIRGMIYSAYRCNLEDELFKVLNVNPNFLISNYLNAGINIIKDENKKYVERIWRGEFFTDGYFKKLFDMVGPNILANSNLEVLIKALNPRNTDYVNQLVKSNPNIIFDDICIFNLKERLLEIYTIEQIAFFTNDDKELLKIVFKMIYIDEYQQILQYYNELISLDPEYKPLDKAAEIRIISKILECRINLPPGIYLQLTTEDKFELSELTARFCAVRGHNPLLKNKFIRKTKKLIEKYQEPYQKKLTK